MAFRNGHIYMRVRNPSLVGKYHILFNLERCIVSDTPEGVVCVGVETYECEYDLNGSNVYEQCYEFIRSEFPDVELVSC